ncbi:MAG: glycoside hydrolase family 97 catalytic domain-containing protein [Bacteroidales bacterium]|nr:glycoside hydrolase family 97 catalytic domain-containing protein [Candidatus Liminaster caballi]
MKIQTIFLLLLLAVLESCTEQPMPLQLKLDDRYILMDQSDFGIQTNMRAWDSTAVLADVSKAQPVFVDYQMKVGKRSRCTNVGLGWTYTLINPQGDTLLVELRVMKDGMAFRYLLPNALDGELLTADLSTYHIPAEAKRWMQRYNGPGYENFFPECPGGILPGKEDVVDWGIPALVEVPSQDNEPKAYILITEADVLKGNCASVLKNTQEQRNDYRVRLFDDSLSVADGWTSPWRVVIAGSLNTIVESTLVNDLATPCQMTDADWIEPGVSSWIYWANNHGSQEYQILKEYVDLAVDMKWPYTLVDAEWDVMRGGNIEQLVGYSLEQGVKPLVWYNSTTNWMGETAPTPQGLLNDSTDRENEFSKIAGWGVKGVKIDFFRDDNAETMAYCIDLINAAARHKMLVNLHGGTIPRGWQRTYPNFISAEGVYGAEWYNNRPVLTDKAAAHNATLPFTRNVIGSMDYTPGTFTDSQHPHITTHAHELALTILFESGIQHMPDRPSAYRDLPEEVRGLLSSLPAAWDDTRLVCGYPADHAVIARRKGNDWYIAGINGLDKPQTIVCNLSSIKDLDISGKCLLVTDGESQMEMKIDADYHLSSSESIGCAPRGGFVMIVKNEK